MFNPTEEERAWLARVIKVLPFKEDWQADALMQGVMMLSSALAGSTDVRCIAASSTGAIVTPRAARVVSVTEERVVFELDDASLASTGDVVIGTTPLHTKGTVGIVATVLSEPREKHLAIIIGTTIVLQVARNVDHYTALANIANGARIAIPSLSVETIGWLGESFHRFRACVIEHLVRAEEQLS